MDLYSRKIIAWTLADTLEVSTVISTIDKAKASRDTDMHLIIHTDRGCQYVSEACRQATEEMTRSYSHTSYPYDNACIESSHSLIKREWMNRFTIRNYRHAYSLVFEYIETFEMDVNMTLEHVTEGHLIVKEPVDAGYPLAVGPTFGHASKFELHNKTWETPGILAKAGCQVSIITDAPVTPLHYLPLCAGLAVKAGMDEFDALQAITINPAKHIGIEDRVGSLEEGKDADIVIMAGSPFEVDNKIKHVLIDGNLI